MLTARLLLQNGSRNSPSYRASTFSLPAQLRSISRFLFSQASTPPVITLLSPFALAALTNSAVLGARLFANSSKMVFSCAGASTSLPHRYLRRGARARGGSSLPCQLNQHLLPPSNLTLITSTKAHWSLTALDSPLAPNADSSGAPHHPSAQAWPNTTAQARCQADRKGRI